MASSSSDMPVKAGASLGTAEFERDDMSDITGDIKSEPETDPFSIWFDPLVDPFKDQPWYYKDFMVRAEEELNPVQGCEVPDVLEAFHEGVTDFSPWYLHPHQIEQLQGAGCKVGPQFIPVWPSNHRYVPEKVHITNYAMPLEQRMLDLLDHMQPGFKQNLVFTSVFPL